MASPTELRVFISSTFRDLQEEREHLIKKIFPEIRSLCRERGVTFTEIDLRWGLTDEQSALGHIIRTCLEEIDRCRPYFIGMIGDRYGWAPAFHEVAMDPDLLTKHPWIEEAVLDESSVTEMEFFHGVFNAPAIDGEGVYFYRRDADISMSDAPLKLQRMIERAEASGHPMRDFTTVEALGVIVHDDLLKMIEQHWPEAESPSLLELERRAHAAFAASRRRAYIAQPEHLRRFNEWSAAEEAPLVVVADPGLGKSSLVTNLVEQYRRRNPMAFVIEHYVGASQRSGTPAAMIRHVVEELRERFAIEEDIPTKEEELERSFVNWLYRAEHLAKQEGVPILIALDAVNQLDEPGGRMTWLPKTIPSGIRLLVSTTRDESYQQLHRRDWQELELLPLEDERLRASIVVRYLAGFHKHISAPQLQQITSQQKACSPLYLRVVAEELRLHGEHETISEVIERYRSADDLDEVFQRVLARMEVDYGVELIEPLLSLLWASRAGLSELELLETTGRSRLELSRVLFALDYHLIRHDGLLGFFHGYLRRGVEKRYLASDEAKRQAHLRLAVYFNQERACARTSRELVWQLHEAGEQEALVEALATIRHLMALYEGETKWEVLGYWAELDNQQEMEQSYRRSLEQWRAQQERSKEEPLVLARVSSLMEATGVWDLAITLQRERLVQAIGNNDQAEEAEARRGIGSVLILRGEYDEAAKELSDAIMIFEELGNHSGLSEVIGKMGVVYANHGDYDRALECYQQQESISRELSDRRGASIAIGNMGNVYVERGDRARALECLSTAAEELRAIGFPSGLAEMLVSLSWVLLDILSEESELPVWLEKYVRPPERTRVLELATSYASESITIANELGASDMRFKADVLLARAPAAGGRKDVAVQRLYTMLKETSIDDQRAELHYWLWWVGRTEDRGRRTEANEEHRTEALRLYRAFVKELLMYEYSKRIDELTAAINPPEISDATE